MEIEEYKNLAEWTQVGQYIHKNEHHQFTIPVYGCDKVYTMCHVVGEVVERSDGRWNWFRMPTDYYSNQFWNVSQHEQGVSKTFEQAKLEVENGFK